MEQIVQFIGSKMLTVKEAEDMVSNAPKQAKLRYSEAFYSVQGEGKFVGVPSVFLRTFGCNFRCMNFGLDRSEPNRAERESKYTPEVENLLNDGILDKVNKFE